MYSKLPYPFASELPLDIEKDGLPKLTSTYPSYLLINGTALTTPYDDEDKSMVP